MTITLRPITAENWISCVMLEPTPEQKAIGFVSPNTLSLAQAHYEPWWQPWGIYADTTMVGFVLYGRWPERDIPAHHSHAEPGVYYVLRFMIDGRYQGRGYGRAAMQRVIEQIKGAPDAHALMLDYDSSNSAMVHLCTRLGFQPTGRILEGEIEARLLLTAADHA